MIQLELVHDLIVSFCVLPTTYGLIALLLFVNRVLPVFPRFERNVPLHPAGRLQPSAVVHGGQWKRLFWSSFLHGQPAHLIYIILWLYSDGKVLETDLGSFGFAVLVVELVFVSNVLETAIVFITAELDPMKYQQLTMTYASDGFSGVLFGCVVVKHLRNFDPKLLLEFNHVLEKGFATDISYILALGLGLLSVSLLCSFRLAFLSYWVPNWQWFTLRHMAGITAGLVHCFFAVHPWFSTISGDNVKSDDALAQWLASTVVQLLGWGMLLPLIPGCDVVLPLLQGWVS